MRLPGSMATTASFTFSRIWDWRWSCSSARLRNVRRSAADRTLASALSRPGIVALPLLDCPGLPQAPSFAPVARRDNDHGGTMAGGTSLPALLGLASSPVSITFLDAAPPGVPRVAAGEPASCGYWRRAAGGEVFHTVADDHKACPVGAHTHHVTLTPAEKRLHRVLALEGEGGGARHHPDALDVGERVDRLARHAEGRLRPPHLRHQFAVRRAAALVGLLGVRLRAARELRGPQAVLNRGAFPSRLAESPLLRERRDHAVQEALPAARAGRRHGGIRFRLRGHGPDPGRLRQEARGPRRRRRRRRRDREGTGRRRWHGRRRGRGHRLVNGGPRREAGEAWAFRARVEREAARRFERLGAAISAFDPGSPVPALLQRAAEDERRHAVLCAELCAAYGQPVDEGVPDEPIAPASLGPRAAVLYEMVAACCLTETESVATLATLLSEEAEPRVREVLHEIARDEVVHSRMGWAHLAHEGDLRADAGGGGPPRPGEARGRCRPCPRLAGEAEQLTG